MKEDNRRNQDTSKAKDKSGAQKFTVRMQKKLVVLFVLVLLAFAGLSVRLFLITRDNGERYKKQVLAQQKYDSITLPYRRGDIVDCKGTSLALSEKVYNLVIDAKVILDKKEYLEPTMRALEKYFPQLDMSKIRKHVQENPSSSYYVPLKRLTYEEISGFMEYRNSVADKDDKTVSGNDAAKQAANVKGIWFQEEYKRIYPNGTLASDVIGFTTKDNIGMYGLEEYYNDKLNGTTGREFGYLNDDSNLERTTKPAVDGYTIVSTLDANIQQIVENKIFDFNEEYKDNFSPGNGANNVGCIIMEVDTGNILAMASYPNFDLNDPYNLSSYYSEEEVSVMKENNTYFDILNGIWRNYCISDTFEPGSTFKPVTVAVGLDTGKLLGNETYECVGYLENVGGHKIRCHNRFGDGIVDVKHAISSSCNVALMKMSFAMGAEVFAEGQSLFNFGLKTNIDLAGEARTVGLLYDKNMGVSDLATNSFGQNFNCTMIQLVAAFSSLVNGGYYYEPHMVSQIRTASGGVVQNIEPRILKQTTSASTSEKIIEYCNATVTEGTGKQARPAGYAIGGKTGTAQTLPRDNEEFIVSFIGYAPADDPQIAIYVVVDRPNLEKQDNVGLARDLVREILTETLPYMGIFMTEELSEAEIAELKERQLEITHKYAPPAEDDGVSGNDPGTGENTEEGGQKAEPIWKSFAKDPSTGCYIDPETGELLDPDTGDLVDSSYGALSD